MRQRRSGGLTLAPCPRPPSALCTRPCSPGESSGVGKRKKGRMWVQKRAVSDSFSKKEKGGTSGIYVQNASKRRSGCPRKPSIAPRKPDLLNAQKATLLNHALPDKNTRSEEPPKKCSCEPDQKGRRMHCTVCSGRVWTRELPEKKYCIQRLTSPFNSLASAGCSLQSYIEQQCLRHQTDV